MKHPTKEPSSNGNRKAPRHGQRWADAGAGLGVCDCAGPKLNVPSLLEALGNPAAVISLEYQILATNQAYRDTFNSGDPVSGRRCYEISHNLAVPCCEAGGRCPLRQAAESGERARAIHLHHTCRGEEQEMVSIHPLFDADHQLISCLEILSPARLAKVRPREGQGLVGRSDSFNHMLELISRVAPADTTVLLLGESGTGKELVAKALHDLGPRARGPFVPVDCSGLTETLFESELFGHEKGAFTGADSRKTGLVEAADGGTLFLDEVGDIPLTLQVKLLRMLETGVFRRVGNIEQIHSDFRLVCATHRDLRAMAKEGSFRSDLYYRISAFPVELPALRERPEDIPLLTEAMLARLGCLRISEVHPEAMSALQDYDFPGNVRELHNILERACLLAEGDTILPDHLPAECRPDGNGNNYRRPLPTSDIVPLEEMESRYLQWALAHFHGDRAQLAHQLGMSERTLYRKLQHHHETHQ